MRILAVVDLSSAQAEAAIENALDVAGSTGADLTLLAFGGRCWPRNAFGRSRRELDIHRVVLPSTRPEAISAYADHIRADIVFMPSECDVTGNKAD